MINRNYRSIKESLIQLLQPLLLVGSILVIMLSMTVIYDAGRANSSSVDRNKLLTDIEMAINNDAELQDIKQIFVNRNHLSPSIKRIFLSSEAEAKVLYKEPVSLNSVLKDLKAEIFLRKEVNKELVNKIKKVLAEHEKINPFDKLEANQRLHFETIQSKLGDGYAYIQQDVNLIVDEMANKNQLVAKYFGRRHFKLSDICYCIGHRFAGIHSASSSGVAMAETQEKRGKQHDIVTTAMGFFDKIALNFIYVCP